MGHHAVERRQLCNDLPPGAGIIANADARSVAHRKHIGAAKRFTGPLAFDLDHRITRELRRGRRYRQAQIDGIAVIVAGKAKFQAYRGFANGALDRLLALFHSAGEGSRSGPKRRMEPALGRERLDDAALRYVRQEAHSAVKARFAAAIRTGHHIERPRPT